MLVAVTLSFWNESAGGTSNWKDERSKTYDLMSETPSIAELVDSIGREPAQLQQNSHPPNMRAN